MSTRSYLVFGLALTAAAAAWQARAGRELVSFPETFAEGVRYATVTRGNIKEDIFTSQAAIDAAKADKPLPSGSVITLVDYRDGKLFRYVVMEKRTGWGAEYPPERRNGEWEYQAFNADKIGEPERRHRPLFRLSQAERAAGVCAHLRSNEAFAISPELDMLNRTRQMRRVVIAALGLGLLTSQPMFSAPAPAVNGNVPSVAPALDKYLQGPVAALWQRPELSLRDRSIVTLAALIARNATAELPAYLDLGLDNGVKPAEISEIVTHLAFYAGIPNATAAITVAKETFARRKIGADQLPAASPSLLALDEAGEADRASRVAQQFGTVAPGLVLYTTEPLFRDVWLRPGLAPRDRSLVTISALIANGQVAQLPVHLNKAMDNGLTQAEAGEVITQLAFYAGWPNAFSALPIAKDVFEKRSKATGSTVPR